MHTIKYDDGPTLWCSCELNRDHNESDYYDMINHQMDEYVKRSVDAAFELVLSNDWKYNSIIYNFHDFK